MTNLFSYLLVDNIPLLSIRKWKSPRKTKDQMIIDTLEQRRKKFDWPYWFNQKEKLKYLWNCFINIDNWDRDEKNNLVFFLSHFFYSDTHFYSFAFNRQKIKRYSTPMSIYTDSFSRDVCRFLIILFNRVWEREREREWKVRFRQNSNREACRTTSGHMNK